jgi:hypothetical protein
MQAKALDPDPFPCRSLRHAVYAALLHFGLESAGTISVRIPWFARSLGRASLSSEEHNDQI